MKPDPKDWRWTLTAVIQGLQPLTEPATMASLERHYLREQIAAAVTLLSATLEANRDPRSLETRQNCIMQLRKLSGQLRRLDGEVRSVAEQVVQIQAAQRLTTPDAGGVRAE